MDFTIGFCFINFLSSDKEEILTLDLLERSITIMPSADQQFLIPKCFRAAMNTSWRDLVKNSVIVILVPFKADFAFQTLERICRLENRTITGLAVSFFAPSLWHDSM